MNAEQLKDCLEQYKLHKTLFETAQDMVADLIDNDIPLSLEQDRLRQQIEVVKLAVNMEEILKDRIEERMTWDEISARHGYGWDTVINEYEKAIQRCADKIIVSGFKKSPGRKEKGI